MTLLWKQLETGHSGNAAVFTPDNRQGGMGVQRETLELSPGLPGGQGTLPSGGSQGDGRLEDFLLEAGGRVQRGGIGAEKDLREHSITSVTKMHPLI